MKGRKTIITNSIRFFFRWVGNLTVALKSTTNKTLFDAAWIANSLKLKEWAVQKETKKLYMMVLHFYI